MRSEPTLNPNGHAPALIDVHEAPTSSPSIELKKDTQSVAWKRSKCGSPPLRIGGGDHTAWEDGGRAVLQVVSANGQRQLAGERVPGAMDLRTLHFAAFFLDFASL
jgi:hypothetical protein